MKQFWVGQSVQLISPILTHEGGEPAVLSGVTFRFFKPDGASVSLSGAQDPDTSEWAATAIVDQVGRWRGEVETAGPLVGVDVLWFEVRARDAL